MNGLDERAGGELLWTPTKGVQRSYDLRAGEETLGTLRWERGTLAAADLGDDHWTFKREGFWHPRVTVRAAGSTTDLAIFRPGWSGAGTLELSPARSVQWRAANMWHSQWAWHEADGRPLLHFKSRQGWTRHEASVTIEPAAVGSPELPLLAALGWYLLVLLAQDTATAAISVTAATAGG